MVPLSLCSTVGLMIILERAWYFFRARVDNPKFPGEITKLLKKGKLNEILRFSQNTRNPIIRVLRTGIGEYLGGSKQEEVKRVLVQAGSQELQDLQKNLGGLSTIAGVAPLLGLLGTVIGMIRCFIEIEKVGGRVDVSLLAGGIWEAMLTTAYGLSIAIPCFLFYSYFMGKINRLEVRMKDVAEELIEVIRKKDGV